MRKCLVLVLAALVLPLPSMASYNDHRNHNLDSLERAVAPWTPEAMDKASEEELFLLNNSYRELMLGYRNFNWDKSLYYSRRALIISGKKNWTYANFDAWRNIGILYYGREQYDSASVYFGKASEAIERMEAGATSPISPEGYSELDIDDAKSSLYGTMGNLYNVMGDIPTAREYYAKAGEIFDKNGWNESNAVLYYNIGETWLDERDFKAAEKAYLKSMDYALASQDSLMVAGAQKGLGRLYMEEGKTWKALRYLHQADEYYSCHELQEAMSRKDIFLYMSKALELQRRLLFWLLIGTVVLLLLTASLFFISRKLRKTRLENEEASVVMEEALEDLHQLPQKSEIPLSTREKVILDLLAKGYTSPQIAECLHLSPETIKWYRKKLIVKFDVANVAELVLKAKDAGVF